MVTLGALLSERDASIALKPLRASARVARAVRAFALSTRARGARVLALMLSALAIVVRALTRHGLVLAGLSLFVLAAWQHSVMAALIVGGLSAFFLEARR